MRVGVIGTEQVGLVTAVTLADVGHDVGALDVDAETIETTFVSLALRGEPITVHGDGARRARSVTSTISSRARGGCSCPTSPDP